MHGNIVLHALRLIEARDYQQLEYFLSDVQNIRKLWRRALRLGAWRRLSKIKWGIITLVANTLERIRSKILLKSILDAFIELIPNLLTRIESRIYEISKGLKNILGNIKLSISIPVEEYIFTHSIKQVTVEYIGFT
ncbi:hypothetical protein DRN87_06240 [Candidatus Geothermarchaeota archaeon]|nr:MAG: hypothetical protein DRN87_06240 [Candidatus Geothermarchaeota archaeon]